MGKKILGRAPASERELLFLRTQASHTLPVGAAADAGRALLPDPRIPQALPEEARGIAFKWHQPELSALEGAIARGDRSLARVIHTAWQKGRTFDGWTEKFVFEPWVESFREHGYDFEAFVGREHSPEASLPWDHLAPPDLKAFLLEEHRRSRGRSLRRSTGSGSPCSRWPRVSAPPF